MISPAGSHFHLYASKSPTVPLTCLQESYSHRVPKLSNVPTTALSQREAAPPQLSFLHLGSPVLALSCIPTCTPTPALSSVAWMPHSPFHWPAVGILAQPLLWCCRPGTSCPGPLVWPPCSQAGLCDPHRMTSSLPPPACAYTASPGVSSVSACAPSHWELAQGAALSGGRSALWVCEVPGTPGAEGSRLSRYCPSTKATGPELIRPHLELPTAAGHALSYWAWEPTGILLPGVPSTASPSRAADRPSALGPALVPVNLFPAAPETARTKGPSSAEFVGVKRESSFAGNLLVTRTGTGLLGTAGHSQEAWDSRPRSCREVQGEMAGFRCK